MNKKSLLSFAAATLLGVAASHAAPILLDFDTLGGSAATAGTTAQAFAPIGLTITFGVWDYSEFDEWGDPVAGSEAWLVDNSYTVTVEDPSVSGWGAAPSGSLALDARDQPVLLNFDAPIDLYSFSVTLDNSSYGNLMAQSILFYDAANQLVGSIAIDQAVPGFVAQSSGLIANVSKIVLPSSALYDNVTIVPEPQTWTLLALAGAALGLAAYRRRRTA